MRGGSALCWTFLLTLQALGVRKRDLGSSGFKSHLHSDCLSGPRFPHVQKADNPPVQGLGVRFRKVTAPHTQALAGSLPPLPTAPWFRIPNNSGKVESFFPQRAPVGSLGQERREAEHWSGEVRILTPESDKPGFEPWLLHLPAV